MFPIVTRSRQLLKAAAFELRDPRLWLPAAALLLPTLLLQLTFPGLLRSRLSPTIWTVITGSLLIAWLTQVAAAASWGWVHAARRRRPVRWASVVPAAVRVGTVTTLGLVAGLLPGLWWQARLAYDPLHEDERHERRRPARLETWALVWLATTTLLVSVLGQSLAAGLAEGLGTIVPAAVVDGRVQFTLRYAPHLITSVVAYAWTVFAVTLQAVGVSVAHGGTVNVPVRSSEPATSSLALRAAVAFAGLAMVVGAVAAVQKVQQHLH